MITQSNFKDVLLALNFEEFEAGCFRRSWHEIEIGCEMVATFPSEKSKGKLEYPSGVIVNDETTSNFLKPENFVVFECVARLLEKGYRPEHIELEPKWQLGREGKSGKADIWIRTIDKNKKKHSLCIIECKTAGHEFDLSWEYTKEDGYQLFSYFNQETETKFLCLYASDYRDDRVMIDYRLINVLDNEEHLANVAKHKKIPTYKNATNAKQRFEAWRETYSLDASSKGLFEEDIQAYEIGKNKYTVSDLSEVDGVEIQKKYHEFATILRQHNVSGHENAFDKLVNLFLAKVVDEINNPRELHFYWKGAAYDDDFRLQDRLQELYSVGMEKFLGEEVTYINEDKVEDAFKLFKSKPDETKDTIRNIIYELKFFSNNDFAFIDVHNEHLFYQNAAILRKIVMMLENIKLRTPDKQNQFLGDLFEGFLDQGVKQSEGQFFTPMPYVKFMVSSLPIAKMVKDMKEPPRVIDYACGAGHFLNEYASQIRSCVDEKNACIPEKEKRSYSEYFGAITGIEKEYRLSKVTKVAAFMYGQDEIKVVYGDALSNLTAQGIKDGSYDILIANPPYAVKGFYEILSESDRDHYSLKVDKKSVGKTNAIETFFIERAAQLLTHDGVAAIILPISIMDKTDAIYKAAREILLENFDLIAIAEMGSGTFGKTGTKTATFFLRRKSLRPNYAVHVRNRIEAWFNGDFTADELFNDGMVLERYASTVNIDVNDYRAFLKGEVNETFLNSELFKDYSAKFSIESKAKKMKGGNLKRYIIDRIVEAEKNKVRIFMLATSNSQDVIIIKSPTKTKEIQQFLGYKWSTYRGKEGIKYLGGNIKAGDEDDVESTVDVDWLERNRGISQINTALFTFGNYEDDKKINYLIRQNYLNSSVVVPDELKSFVSVKKLCDMIDFTKIDFDFAFVTTKMSRIESKYELKKLGGETGICDIRIGGTPDTGNASYYGGTNLWVSIAEMKDNVITKTERTLSDAGVKNSNVKLVPKGTTLLSFKMSIGKTALTGVDLYTNEAIAALIPKDKSVVLDKYLFYFFSSRILDIGTLKGDNAISKSLNSTILKNDVLVPVPPKTIQEKIVKECENIDEEYGKLGNAIAGSKEIIAAAAKKKVAILSKYLK